MAASVTSDTSAFLPAKSASSSMHSMVISVESMSKQIRPKSESLRPASTKAQSSFSASMSGIRASNSGVRRASVRRTTCGGRGCTAAAPVAATIFSSRKVGKAPPWMIRFMDEAYPVETRRRSFCNPPPLETQKDAKCQYGQDDRKHDLPEEDGDG